jgi:hypothetical protein
MPSTAAPQVARHARAGRARTGARAEPRREVRLGAIGRIPWEQLARLAMLCVMVALAYLYLSAGIRMFSTWRQARHDHATVSLMEAERRRLATQHALLSKPETLVREARQLGMVKKGEQQYVLSGLPGD